MNQMKFLLEVVDATIVRVDSPYRSRTTLELTFEQHALAPTQVELFVSRETADRLLETPHVCHVEVSFTPVKEAQTQET